MMSDLPNSPGRIVVLDTETTGLEPRKGHRIIEVGCVELLNRQATGNNFHFYINPQRLIDEGAIEVHGITNESLLDKPLFEEIADDLFQYLKGAEVVIHNAPFDVGFLDHEYQLMGADHGKMRDWCEVTDTLVMARKMFPGQRNSLDALCKRYEINNSQRVLHGALLDAEILADVYLAMTGGQSSLMLDEHLDSGTAVQKSFAENRPRIKIIKPNEDEAAFHQKRLQAIDTASSGNCVWTKH